MPPATLRCVGQAGRTGSETAGACVPPCFGAAGLVRAADVGEGVGVVLAGGQTAVAADQAAHGDPVLAQAGLAVGGLGAMEAALVAGLTGFGVDSGIAVAAVLSYRLVTYLLPILPGWLSFHSLERHNLI